MKIAISSLDYIVILVYITLIFLLAYYSSKSVKVTGSNFIEDQYLASKSLTFWESILSIIATEVSALTFLGIPAIAYGGTYSFLQIYLGAALGRVVIAKVMLPKIYGEGLTLYSVMAKKGGTSGGQRSVAIFYALNKFLAVGVRLFSGSILISEFFSLSIYSSVAIICALTFFYTLIGGLKAVVRTDMAQMFLFTLGGVIAHFYIPSIAQVSWGELIGTAYAHDKISLFNAPGDYWGLFVGITGGFLFDIGTHGCDQDFLQRLTGNKSLKGAQNAIMLSSFLSIGIAILFLGIGSLLWSYYQQVTPPSLANDQLFAHFITTYFPSGLKGLMVAGVLAATMSTLDSTINALSATLYSDIFHHKSTVKAVIEKAYRTDTFIITVLLMVIAFIAADSDGVLILGLKITSWTAGSLLALVFFTLLSDQFRVSLTSFAVIGAYIFGVTCVALNTYIILFPWQWNVYFGFIGSAVYLIALIKYQSLITAPFDQE